MQIQSACLLIVGLCQLVIQGQTLPTGKELAQLKGGKVASLAFSPDNSLLAVAETHRVVVWDVAKRKVKLCPVENDRVHFDFVAFSRDGKQLYARSAKSPDTAVLYSWDVPSGNQTSSKELPSQERFVYSPEAKLALTLDRENKRKIPRVFDLAADAKWDLRKHQEAILDLLITPDGKIITVTTSQIQVWDRTSGNRIHEIGVYDKREASRPYLAVSPDSTRLIALGLPHPFELGMFDLRKGKKIGEPILDLREPVAFHPDSKHLVGILVDRGATELVVWNIEGQRPIMALPSLLPKRFSFATLAISSDGKWVALGNSYGGISVWELPDLNTLKKKGKGVSTEWHCPLSSL